MMKNRCRWVSKEQIYIDYHDQEWGVAVTDSLKLFEMLCLEGAQAGLSWITVLKKREHYRKVFDGFDPVKMSKYDQRKKDLLLLDAGIIRNKLKINAFIINAQNYLAIEEQQSFSVYLWQFVDHKTIINQHKDLNAIPSTSLESDAMSKQLKKDGFKFVGSTICYAFMQACGMVDDHAEDCFIRVSRNQSR
jgi:DNA-3-methyladenine glycosylase I